MHGINVISSLPYIIICSLPIKHGVAAVTGRAPRKRQAATSENTTGGVAGVHAGLGLGLGLL